MRLQSNARAASAVLLVLAPVALAQNKPALTALDYIEIQQLVSRLHFALDYCTNGGQDFADLFVKSGRFVIDEGGAKLRTFTTRQQLVALAGGPDCKELQSTPRSYVLHTSENLVIEASRHGARGKSYAIYPPSKGKYFKEGIAGQVGLYHDRYVRTPDGWRFQYRWHEVSPVVGRQFPVGLPNDD